MRPRQVLLDYSLSEETVAVAGMLMVERNRFPDLLRKAGEAMRKLDSTLIGTVLEDMAARGLLRHSGSDMYPHYFYGMIVCGNQLQRLIDTQQKLMSEQEIDERVSVSLHGMVNVRHNGQDA